jgi:hypothetical protein
MPGLRLPKAPQFARHFAGKSHAFCPPIECASRLAAESPSGAFGQQKKGGRRLCLQAACRPSVL